MKKNKTKMIEITPIPFIPVDWLIVLAIALFALVIAWFVLWIVGGLIT